MEQKLNYKNGAIEKMTYSELLEELESIDTDQQALCLFGGVTLYLMLGVFIQTNFATNLDGLYVIFSFELIFIFQNNFGRIRTNLFFMSLCLTLLEYANVLDIMVKLDGRPVSFNFVFTFIMTTIFLVMIFINYFRYKKVEKLKNIINRQIFRSGT